MYDRWVEAGYFTADNTSDAMKKSADNKADAMTNKSR